MILLLKIMFQVNRYQIIIFWDNGIWILFTIKYKGPGHYDPSLDYSNTFTKTPEYSLGKKYEHGSHIYISKG
jgi:hypothetical protein